MNIVSNGINLDAGACHELRTSLNVITGLAELLLSRGTGCLDRDQRACIRDILTSGRKIEKLIKDAPGAASGEIRGKAGDGNPRRRKTLGKKDPGS